MANISINDLNRAIMFQKWDNDQLNSMVQALKYARGQLTKQNIRSIQMGAKVKFVDRNGRSVTGEVTKVAKKFVTVKTQQGMFGTSWRVPANMLEAA